jgi:hypothetical protein
MTCHGDRTVTLFGGSGSARVRVFSSASIPVGQRLLPVDGSQRGSVRRGAALFGIRAAESSRRAYRRRTRSSPSRVTAGYFVLTQSAKRPARYFDPGCFETMPSRSGTTVAPASRAGAPAAEYGSRGLDLDISKAIRTAPELASLFRKAVVRREAAGLSAGPTDLLNAPDKPPQERRCHRTP